MPSSTEEIESWKRSHYSTDIPKENGLAVIVMGWARAIRNVGKLTFVQLADREGTVQLIFKNVNIEIQKKLDVLQRESVIAIKGTVQLNKEAPNGLEIIPSDLKILNLAHTPLPLEVVTEKTPADLPTCLDQRVLDLRKPEKQAIFKIQATLVNGIEEFLIKRGFIRTFTPTLMGVASESGSEMFEVPYFGKTAYLRQDPQLHRQLVIGAGFDKIFDTGVSWRAEKSNTHRHLCEHRGIAVEFAFLKDEQETMRLEEEVILAGIKAINKYCKKELAIISKKNLKVPKTPFPELRFPEIYSILKKYGKELKEGDDLDREAEKILADHVAKKFKSDFFFINRFPFAHKPFYVMREGKYARSVDLEARGGIELSSGGQREHQYEELIKNIKEKDMKSVEWFSHFFKFGFPSHGGFCLGIERLTMVLLDLDNIREAALFPRDPQRLLP